VVEQDLQARRGGTAFEREDGQHERPAVAAPTATPASFRDWTSRVVEEDGRILRLLAPEGLAAWEALEATGLYERLAADGRLVRTSARPDVDRERVAHLLPRPVAGVLEHERLPFITYPYEWSFSMLRDAARLHLELLLESLDNGLTLRDGSPYNIQWRGAQPIFIDVGSFDRTGANGPWAGYRQFCQLFLNPLLLESLLGLPFQPLLRGRLAGIEPSELRALLRRRHRLRRGVLTHVVLHAALDRRMETRETVAADEAADAGLGSELAGRSAKGLLRMVDRLRRPVHKSAWTGYAAAGYEAEEDAAKRRFVEAAVGERRWPLVWDLGCNDGRYTRLAAAAADAVLALDADAQVIDDLYCSLREERDTTITPLVMNLADPSPSLGWEGRERLRLEARGTPDLVLALALVHHVALDAGVPLDRLLGWLGSLGSSLIVEFVDRGDPMVELLLGRKGPGAHPDYTAENFEACLRAHFEVRATEAVTATRTLYFAHPRGAAQA
jgi:hypothetical protein